VRRRRRAGAAARKSAHVEACLRRPVEYRTRTTGLERFDLPYCALPDSDLGRVDTSLRLLGRRLEAPVLIGAMTGGGRHSARINRNLAAAAQRLGVGMMLGSQRIMLEDPATLPSFKVRPHAPDVLLLGNLGVAQLNRGYGAAEVAQAIELVGGDGLALHANPLQEALQAEGDGDFRGLAERIADVAEAVERPLVLKEVGHGLGANVVRAVAGCGLAGLDVAGAGGTSWARVEQFVRHGRIVHPQLAEWGIPTAEAVAAARLEAPELTLIASGGIRTGVDAAKAIALGADAVALALPLLRPALESADAVCAVLERLLAELRVAMHCTGARTLDELREVELAAALAPVPA
jgi:isopentenyl-diphosphate delta-isomerase